MFILQSLFQSAQHIYLKKEGSGAGSVPLTNGSGSGRLKNMRILRFRIRFPTLQLSLHFIQAMEVDTRPTEQYSDIGGLDKQIQELVEAVVLPMTHKDRFVNLGIKPPKAGLEKTRVFFNNKTQPSGFFWVFWVFLGFFGFFWVFFIFAQKREFLGFFSVSRILLGASRL